jgi:transaldolase
VKLYIDTANVEEIKRAKELVQLDGATTNPTLIARVGHKPEKVYREICALIDGPVNTEVTSETVEGMLEEAMHLRKIAKNVTIKIPITSAGLQTVRILSARRIPTTVTLVFSATQALLAARAGANYICPFVGRLDDTGVDGMQVVRDIVEIYSRYKISTQVVVASVRNTDHVLRSALYGADAVTIPYRLFDEMLTHPLTDAGIEKFRADILKLKTDLG